MALPLHSDIYAGHIGVLLLVPAPPVIYTIYVELWMECKGQVSQNPPPDPIPPCTPSYPPPFAPSTPHTPTPWYITSIHSPWTFIHPQNDSPLYTLPLPSPSPLIAFLSLKLTLEGFHVYIPLPSCIYHPIITYYHQTDRFFIPWSPFTFYYEFNHTCQLYKVTRLKNAS